MQLNTPTLIRKVWLLPLLLLLQLVFCGFRVFHTAFVLLLLCLFLNTSCFLINSAPEVRRFRPGSTENPPRKYGNCAPEVRSLLTVLLLRWKPAQPARNECFNSGFAPEVRWVCPRLSFNQGGLRTKSLYLRRMRCIAPRKYGAWQIRRGAVRSRGKDSVKAKNPSDWRGSGARNRPVSTVD